MFSNIPVWVVCVVVALLFLVVFGVVNNIRLNTPRAKAARARNEEKDRQRREKEEREAKEQAAQEVKQLDIFRKQRFVVYIRAKDGGKSGFESWLVSEILKMGATVEPIEEKDGRAIANGNTEALKNGLLAVVGTAWCTKKTVYDAGDLYIEPFSYTRELTFCDYRLLVRSQGAAKIIGAGNTNDECFSRYNSTAERVAHYLLPGMDRLLDKVTTEAS